MVFLMASQMKSLTADLKAALKASSKAASMASQTVDLKASKKVHLMDISKKSRSGVRGGQAAAAAPSDPRCHVDPVLVTGETADK